MKTWDSKEFYRIKSVAGTEKPFPKKISASCVKRVPDIFYRIEIVKMP